MSRRLPTWSPAANTGEGDTALARRLRAMARTADELRGDADAKLVRAAQIVRRLLDDGFGVIVFCRFIQTAEYVAEEFGRRLGRRIAVEAVTGELPPAERESRVRALAGHARRVLVATDCLSEGINLQDHFTSPRSFTTTCPGTRLASNSARAGSTGSASRRPPSGL